MCFMLRCLLTDNPKPVPEPVLGDGARNMPAMKKSQWVTPSITKRNLDESNLIQKYMAGLSTYQVKSFRCVLCHINFEVESHEKDILDSLV